MSHDIKAVCASCYGEFGEYYLLVNISKETYIGLCEICLRKAIAEIEHQKQIPNRYISRDEMVRNRGI